MKKTYYIKNLDCANCALKIESEFKKLEGVNLVNVDFAQELIFIDSKKTYDAKSLEKIAQKIEDQVEIHEEKVTQEKQALNIELIINIIGVFILAFTFLYTSLNQNVTIVLYILSYVMIGGKVLYKAIKNIIQGQLFDEHFLMSLATIGAFIIGEYIEGVSVMLFYRMGEFLQDLAVQNSKKSIQTLMDIKPEIAHLQTQDGVIDIKPESLAINQIIIIYPGEKIPVDGIVIDGTSSLDTSKLTGESIPRDIYPKDIILSGSINLSGVIKMEVQKVFEDSTVAKIIAFAKDHADKKARTEKFITRFAKLYTPIVVILAICLGFLVPLLDSILFSTQSYMTLLPHYIKRSLIFLVISCPCALVLSIPLSFFSGIGASSKKGILVKSGSDLEMMSEIKHIVFDKTGTLTKGSFEVTKIVSNEPKKLITLAAHLESFSSHPIAKSIVNYYNAPINQDKIESIQEIFGQGLIAQYEKKTLLVGNQKLLISNQIEVPEHPKGNTYVHVVYDHQYLGYITLSDVLKKDSLHTITTLKQQGIQVYAVTGDTHDASQHMLSPLNVSIYSQCLPEEKVNIIQTFMEKGKTAFIGDGVNDAPVLMAADLGVAMGGIGSDAAIEAADVIIMNDEPSKVLEAIDISKKTMKIVKQNIILAIGIKVIVLILGALGFANMWLAIFADVGVSLLAVFNSLRIFTSNKKSSSNMETSLSI
jgi:Cd2+/Zn2+-exporting ATPase